MNKWFKLDNAAKLFPSVASVKNSSVFRVSAVLTDIVDGVILQKTVDFIYSRFPTFFVKMHRGVFWNYFDDNAEKFRVQEETEYPCGNFTQTENDGYFIRILYFSHRISVEAFHSLTDGSGVIELLKTILYYYFSYTGCPIDDEGKVLLVGDGVSAEETEDSFSKNDKKVPLLKYKKSGTFIIKGTPFESFGNNVITGVISASELNKLAKEKNATITSYLASVLIHSIYAAKQKYTADKNPISVCVPVNLRKAFQSKSLRNFFTVVNIDVKMDDSIRFEAIIEAAGAQLKSKTEKSALQERISYNMKFESGAIKKFAPLFLKKLFIMIGFRFMGGQTVSLSNLGNIAVPSGFASKLNLMECILYPMPKSPVVCGVCSVNDRLAISFSRTVQESDIIQTFFNYLTDNSGLKLSVYSNDWGILR